MNLSSLLLYVFASRGNTKNTTKQKSINTFEKKKKKRPTDNTRVSSARFYEFELDGRVVNALMHTSVKKSR